LLWKEKKHFLFGFHKFNIYYLDFPDFQAFRSQSKQKLFLFGFPGFLFGFRLDPTLARRIAPQANVSKTIPSYAKPS
jgi:hypothetical protein